MKHFGVLAVLLVALILVHEGKYMFFRMRLHDFPFKEIQLYRGDSGKIFILLFNENYEDADFSNCEREKPECFV